MTYLKPLPDLQYIQNWWSAGRTDNAPCATEDCVTDLRETDAGYERVRIEALLLKEDKGDGTTLPLTLYYSEANTDYAAVLNYNMTTSGYQFVSVQGYVYSKPQLGTIPLDLYFSKARHDNYLVGSESSRDDAAAGEYVLVGRQGYAYPGPHYVPVSVSDSESTPKYRCQRMGCKI